MTFGLLLRHTTLDNAIPIGKCLNYLWNLPHQLDTLSGGLLLVELASTVGYVIGRTTTCGTCLNSWIRHWQDYYFWNMPQQLDTSLGGLLLVELASTVGYVIGRTTTCGTCLNSWKRHREDYYSNKRLRR